MKKQLENNEIDYDYSHVQGNHAHNRSKSMFNSHGPPMDGAGGYSALNPDSRPMDHNQHQQLLSMMPGGLGGGGGPQEPQNINMNQHSRSPSLKVRRYSFLAGSRRGRGFSEIFNSTILNDHFDQYAAADSGIDGDGLGMNNSSSNHSANPHSHSNHSSLLNQPPANPSPDSGVSDSMEEGDSGKNRALQRRRTMPCIVNDPTEAAKAVDQLAAAKQQLSEKETAHSSLNLSHKNQDSFIIENGIRKRIRAEIHSNPDKELRQLPKEYKVMDTNSLRGGAAVTDKRGSLPDLAAVTGVKPMSRREAYQLSTQRREELRRIQDLAERRRQGDVSVILGDVRVSRGGSVHPCLTPLVT